MGDMQELEKIVALMKGDDLEATPGDPYLMREAWLQVVKPVANAGRLDSIQPQKAVTKRQQHQAQVQNYYLTRKCYSMPLGYERIRWNSQEDIKHAG